ncbi:MAG: SusC/RagA family TonB-linked outer membrane protein [Cyclobacteriaceae bacterium]
MVFSNEGEAQRKSIEEIYVSIDIEDLNMAGALERIEEVSDFSFAYKKSILDKKRKLNLKKSNVSLADLLRDIGSNNGLQFKRINDKIYVSKGKVTQKKIAEIEEDTQADITVTGTITDENNQGLPGVTIRVLESNVGTTTDITGKYTLTVADDAVLVISYVGYRKEEVSVGGRTVIDMQLALGVESLQEVVVTALGIEKDKKTLGYATSNVASEELTTNRQSQFMNSLQGKVAGVKITQLGSGPQGSTKIRIRGVSSFGGNNQPLIVVNGVPIDNQNFGVSNGDNRYEGNVADSNTADTGDGLSSINPDDIESMSILKGGPAAALYGYRAKDGVIMITTKNRSEGSGIQVRYNLNVTTGSLIDLRDYQFEYGMGEQGVRPTTPYPTSGQWSFGEPMGGTFTIFDDTNVPYQPQRNQLKDFYNNSSNVTNTLSVSTGGENGGMNFSVSNQKSKGIHPGNKFNKKTINLGFTQKISKLTVSGNVNYSNEEIINPPGIGQQQFSAVVMYNLGNTIPMDVLRDNAFSDEGYENPWSRFSLRTNPYFSLKRINNTERDRVFGNVTARYDLTDWLYVQGRFGQDFWYRDQEINIPHGVQFKSPAPAGFENGEYVRDLRKFREINTDFLIGVNKEFGDFGVVANFGGNHMYQKRDINTERGTNFYQSGLYTIGNSIQVEPAYTLRERIVNSIYGSLELSYKGYLYLNYTARNDWFSTLSEDQRSIMYPSLTGSWVFSQTFASLPDWFSFGKIRAGYSEVGSDSDVAPYSDQLFYNVNPLTLNGSPIGSVSGGTIPNPNLKPMRVIEKEFGIEAMLFDNLELEFSGYVKTSKDQILNRQVSSASGYDNQNINVGESENKGVEIAASYSPIRNDDLEWRISANASFNKSKVISLGDNVDGTSIRVGGSFFHGELRQVVGQPMAQLYGYEWLRDAQGRIIHGSNGKPQRNPDQVSFGSALPTSWGGITNSLSYKGVNFSFLIDWTAGNKVISGTHVNAYRHGLDKASLLGREDGFVIGDGVTEDGSVNTVQVPVQSYHESMRGARLAELSVFDGGSWQLRQITVSYDLMKVIPENKYINGAVLSLVANNVAVLSQDIPHVHPDQNGIISDREQGLEATGVPVTRDIGFNLSIKF